LRCWILSVVLTVWANFLVLIGFVGFSGRIDVFRVASHPDQIADYLAKHFAKDIGRSRHGMRKWACTGGFKGSGVRDIVCTSNYLAWRRLRVGGRRMRFDKEILLRREWLWSGL